jgi:hypothetical protein
MGLAERREYWLKSPDDNCIVDVIWAYQHDVYIALPGTRLSQGDGASDVNVSDQAGCLRVDLPEEGTNNRLGLLEDTIPIGHW